MKNCILVLLVAIITLVPSLSPAAGIKIGVINSMTGPEAPIGENLTSGIKLAQEDLKKKRIFVDLIWEDDTGKPQIAMSAMEKLPTRDRVAGVVGPYTSACVNAVARLSEKYKTPLLVPAAAKEEITRQGYKWGYRMNAPADVHAAVLIDAAMTLGLPPLLVKNIFDIITGINRNGVTVLLVEQNVYQSLRIAQRGYVLETGKVVLSGTGEKLLNDDHVKKAFLGM